MTSLTTLGAVDFRSDKERTASYTKRSAREGRKQTAILGAQLEQMRVNQQMQAPVSAMPPPSWCQCPHDPPGVLRWWTGAVWGDQTRQPAPPQQQPMAHPQLAGPAALSGGYSIITAEPDEPSAWYPCPYGSGLLRWWNGTVWTDQTQPMG